MGQWKRMKEMSSLSHPGGRCGLGPERVEAALLAPPHFLPEGIKTSGSKKRDRVDTEGELGAQVWGLLSLLSGDRSSCLYLCLLLPLSPSLSLSSTLNN